MPSQQFAGFALPTSNTTYTPNQFFDVCLPHCSRGTVRLVALLIRKTLGWCDAQGRPQAEQHTVSYADFERAGISRDMIKSSIEEAVKAHLIRCVRAPQAKASGKTSISGLYELQWDEKSDEYIKDPKRFRGFFAGEGNRTYIPNQFFDEVVSSQTLAVVKVVGSVIRFSIGYQNKWGHRRRDVALSFQHLQNYSRIRDRKTLSAAVHQAMAANYIERVTEGYFDPDGGKLSRAAVYAIKWRSEAVEAAIGQKSLPAENSLKIESEIPTGIGPKTPPADRSEIPTDIEIKQTNKTLKQQNAVTLERLKEAGFDAQAAQTLASRFSVERVERQIRWLDRRHVKHNRLGLLRMAIEQDWPAPSAAPARGELGQPNLPSRGSSFAEALEGARRKFISPTNSSTS
jgi:hypothetical protein